MNPKTRDILIIIGIAAGVVLAALFGIYLQLHLS
jgi:hypothetical protein